MNDAEKQYKKGLIKQEEAQDPAFKIGKNRLMKIGILWVAVCSIYAVLSIIILPIIGWADLVLASLIAPITAAISFWAVNNGMKLFTIIPLLGCAVDLIRLLTSLSKFMKIRSLYDTYLIILAISIFAQLFACLSILLNKRILNYCDKMKIIMQKVNNNIYLRR